MDCLTLFMGSILLVSSALAIGGFHWDQPVAGYVFGFFAVVGGIPFFWVSRRPASRKRRRGDTFRRVFNAIVAAMVVVVLLWAFVVAARARGAGPGFFSISLFVSAIVGGIALLIWWGRFTLRKSWQQAADRMGLRFDRPGPCVSGDYRGRRVQLALRSVFRGITMEGVARWMRYTHLTTSLRASVDLTVTVRKRGRIDKLFRRSRSRPFGDRALDNDLTCEGDVDTLIDILQDWPVLRDHVLGLLGFPLLELRIAPTAMIYVCRNGLKGTERIIGVFDLMGDIAGVFEVRREMAEQRGRLRREIEMDRDLATIAGSLRRIQDDGGGGSFVVFTLDEEKGYYIQLAVGPREGLLWAEAVSNKFLQPEFALSPERTARLESMGWNAPRQSSNFKNFYREWEAASDGDRLQIARETVRVMVEVYGWAPGQSLQVELVLQDSM